MRVTLRPLPDWPYEATSPRRDAQFRTPSRRIDTPSGPRWEPSRRIGYDVTLRELEYEVDMLDGSDVVIGVGLTEFDIRLDGAPRANARPMRHPGVEVSFNSRYGRLTYATDVFTDWRDNVRAVTKGLEALRAIDRWGVAKRGQQYAGFALLTAGPGREELGRRLVEKHGSVAAALRATHPDTGDDEASTDAFQAVLAYRDQEVAS
ncbi:MAG: hypothetical protein ACOYB2_10985 [Limnohabitans sp.]